MDRSEIRAAIREGLEVKYLRVGSVMVGSADHYRQQTTEGVYKHVLGGQELDDHGVTVAKKEAELWLGERREAAKNMLASHKIVVELKLLDNESGYNPRGRTLEGTFPEIEEELLPIAWELRNSSKYAVARVLLHYNGGNTPLIQNKKACIAQALDWLKEELVKEIAESLKKR